MTEPNFPLVDGQPSDALEPLEDVNTAIQLVDEAGVVREFEILDFVDIEVAPGDTREYALLEAVDAQADADGNYELLVMRVIEDDAGNIARLEAVEDDAEFAAVERWLTESQTAQAGDFDGDIAQVAA